MKHQYTVIGPQGANEPEGLDSSRATRMYYDRVMALPQHLPETGDFGCDRLLNHRIDFSDVNGASLLQSTKREGSDGGQAQLLFFVRNLGFW